MKKYIAILLLMILCVCGCEYNNIYEGFEHYDLNYVPKKLHIDENGNFYAVTDITKEQDEGGVNGVFYKINEHDYILLDKIGCCGYTEAYKEDSYTFFYKNKLYLIRCTGNLLEYTLNEEKYEKRELEFDTQAISSKPLEYVQLNSITKVSDNKIYYKGSIHNTYRTNLDIVCSLDTMKCTLDN